MSEFIKIRPAPNGKFYAVWYGQPVCDADDGLRYFENEDAALEFIERCNAATLRNFWVRLLLN
jgi:hypothetical protein